MERNNEELVYSPQSVLDTDLYQVIVHPYRSASSAERKGHAVHNPASHPASLPRHTSSLQIHQPGLRRTIPPHIRRSASQVHPTYVLPRIVRCEVCKSLSGFRDLRLTLEEKNWLANTCPYFSNDYLEYLSEFQFNPAQISIRFVPVSDDGEEGRVEIEAGGLWREAILWEVPLRACLSELYFRVGSTDWSYEGQKR
jgi:hypothetical protein